MEHHLSIEESLRFGWEKTRAHSALLFQIMLTLFAVQIAQEIIKRVLGGTLEGALASAAIILVSIVVGIGFTVIILRIARGQHATYQDLMPPFKVCMSYIVANILSSIVTVMPLLLGALVSLIGYTVLPNQAALAVCIVAMAAGTLTTFYFALRYLFVRFAILEDQDAIKSLRTSAHMTHDRKWWLAGFIVVVILVNILGAILLLVGLLISIPVTMIAMAHVYVKLHSHHSA